MDRRLWVLLGTVISLVLAYAMWLTPMGAPGLTTCPSTSGEVNITLTTSGFRFDVGGPFFTGHQLVLAPGSAATVMIEMTSGSNITEYLQDEVNVSACTLGPFSSMNNVIDASRGCETPAGWSDSVISPSETGINVQQVSFDKVNDYTYTAVYVVSASIFARSGTYQAPMFFDGPCSGYYLTIGYFPYTGAINGFPQPITWPLPFVLIALLGCTILFLSAWAKRQRATLNRNKGTAESVIRM